MISEVSDRKIEQFACFVVFDDISSSKLQSVIFDHHMLETILAIVGISTFLF